MDFITYHISTLLRGRDAGATPLEATLDNDDLLRHIVALTLDRDAFASFRVLRAPAGVRRERSTFDDGSTRPGASRGEA